ncbi:MAG: hypothetical protein NVS1B7_2770 [Candidatus Saccharimonadales bacterium]
MVPKKYFHDRMILLLLSCNTFIAILGVILVLLRLDVGRPGTYIVQYRSNLGRLDGPKSGNITTFIGFIVFNILVLIFHTILSIRVFKINRQLSVLVLSIGLLLLILSVVVSYSLLGNH